MEANSPNWENFDVTFLHSEFSGRADGNGYTFPPGYRRPGYPWDGEEFNLGFVILNNDVVRKEFVAESKRFMSGNPGGAPFNHACFAEQYLLAQCAKARSAKVNALLPGPPHDESRVAHIWGDKQKLREEPVRAWALVNRYITRLKQDFSAHVSGLNRLFAWASSTVEAAARQSQNNRRNVPELRRRPRRYASATIVATPARIIAALPRPALARTAPLPASARQPDVSNPFPAAPARRRPAAGFLRNQLATTRSN